MMGHQNQESNNELKIVEVIPKEKEKNVHPFLEKNDITFLSIINPLLSPNGQRLVSFFINFGNNEAFPPLNFSDLINQFSNKQKNSATDFLPSLLNMLSNPELKNSFSPALITTLLSMLNTKKEE